MTIITDNPHQRNFTNPENHCLIQSCTSCAPRQLKSIRFIPNRGIVLSCDLRHLPTYEMGGKIRPVVVVSPSTLNDQMVFVAPISRASHLVKPNDIHIPSGRYSFFPTGRDRWIKTGFVMPVHRTRLGRWRAPKGLGNPQISADDLRRVCQAIANIFPATEETACSRAA